MRKKKSLNDILICIGIFAFLGVFVAQLGEISAEAKGYPMFLIICSALLTGALLIKSIRSYRREQTGEADPMFKQIMLLVITYTLLFAAYIFLLDKIGYILSTLLFVVISLLMLQVRKLPVLVLLPLGLTFAMYFLFTKFLMVTLPSGSWLSFLM